MRILSGMAWGLLLAAALALSCGLDGARAQVTCGGDFPPCPPHIPMPSHRDNTGVYVAGGIVTGFIVSIILSKVWPATSIAPPNPALPSNPAVPSTSITPASLQPPTINLPPSFPGVPGGGVGSCAPASIFRRRGRRSCRTRCFLKREPMQTQLQCVIK